MSLLRLLYHRLSGAARRALSVDEEWAALELLYDRMGLPRQWVTCSHCGSQAWRYPPHGADEPCPLVKETADALGLRFDAERMASLRSGAQVEAVTQAFHEFIERQREEGDQE